MIRNDKCMFFDFDGTLYIDRKISEETLKALEYARKNGWSLFVSTGRPKASLVADLKRATDFKFDGILCGGVSAYFGGDYAEKVCEDVIDAKILDKALRFFAKISAWVVVEGAKANYTMELHGEKYYPLSKRERFYRRAKKATKDNDVIKFSVFPPKGKEYLTLDKELVDFDWMKSDVSKKDVNDDTIHVWYEGYQKGKNKGVLIDKIAEKFGVDKENFIAFGDSVNDLTAFEHTKKNVAMKKSPNELKEKASFIATTDEGVAEGIYHYVK